MWPKWRQLINYRSNCQFGSITSLWPRWKQLIIYRSLNVETRSFMAAVKNNPPQDTATHPHQQCTVTSKQIRSNTATTTNAAATTATGSGHYYYSCQIPPLLLLLLLLSPATATTTTAGSYHYYYYYFIVHCVVGVQLLPSGPPNLPFSDLDFGLCYAFQRTVY